MKEDKLNDCLVIASGLLPSPKDTRQGRIILVDAGEAKYHYAVAYNCLEDDFWCEGSYFDDEIEASEAFTKRWLKAFKTNKQYWKEAKEDLIDERR